VKRDATSEQQAIITLTAIAASKTAKILARPSKPARTEGNPNTPLPMTQFTMSAAMLQRPMARTKPSAEVRSCAVSVTARFYHKWETRWQCCGGFIWGLVTLELMTTALTFALENPCKEDR